MAYRMDDTDKAVETLEALQSLLGKRKLSADDFDKARREGLITQDENFAFACFRATNRFPSYFKN